MFHFILKCVIKPYTSSQCYKKQVATILQSLRLQMPTHLSTIFYNVTIVTKLQLQHEFKTLLSALATEDCELFTKSQLT